jgi:small subunit ribosomal protein S20
MANTKSAKKAIRVSERKRLVNVKVKKNFRKARKDILEAITSADNAKVAKLLPLAYKSIDKAVKGRVIEKNTAARYKSSMAKKANALKK